LKTFTLINRKDTANFTIFNPEVKEDSYEFLFKFRDGRTSDVGEVVIQRNESLYNPNTFYLDVRWKERTNSIYSENVIYEVFGKKVQFFEKLDEIILEKIKAYIMLQLENIHKLDGKLIGDWKCYYVGEEGEYYRIFFDSMTTTDIRAEFPFIQRGPDKGIMDIKWKVG